MSESGSDDTLRELKLDQLVPNPFQPRRTFEEEPLQELAATIRESGVLQPLVVRRVAHDQYQIIAGERRFRASKLAGLETVPVQIRQATDDEMLALALVENLQREDINAADAALAYRRLIDEFGLNHDQIAARVGKSRGQVANAVRLLNLPGPLFEGLRQGNITEGHARAILSLDDPEKQRHLYNSIVDEALSVRQAETRSRFLRTNTDERVLSEQGGPMPTASDPHLVRIEQIMSERLGVRVRVQLTGEGAGRIVIPFYNQQQLSQFCDWLQL